MEEHSTFTEEPRSAVILFVHICTAKVLVGHISELKFLLKKIPARFRVEGKHARFRVEIILQFNP